MIKSPIKFTAYIKFLIFSYKSIILGTVSLLNSEALAYPEMVKIESVSCGSCHVSPQGGGILNLRGRRSIDEHLVESPWPSQFKYDFGTLSQYKLPEWFNLGGDFRYLWGKAITPPTQRSWQKLVQRDIEINIISGRLALNGTYSGPEYPTQNRRHWARYQFQDQWNFRLGKFQPVFGINSPYHFLATRDPLGFGIGSEQPGGEINYSETNREYFISTFKSDYQSEERSILQGFWFNDLGRYQGLGFEIRKNIYESQFALAYSFMSGDFNKFTLIGELVLTHSTDLITEKKFQGLYQYLLVKYWFRKGLSFTAFQDAAVKKMYSSSQQKYSGGIGIDWHPITHLQIETILQEIQDLAYGPETLANYVFQLHFYL